MRRDYSRLSKVLDALIKGRPPVAAPPARVVFPFATRGPDCLTSWGTDCLRGCWIDCLAGSERGALPGREEFGGKPCTVRNAGCAFAHDKAWRLVSKKRSMTIAFRSDAVRPARRAALRVT